MTTLLATNAEVLVTMDGQRRELRNASLYAENGMIKQPGLVPCTHPGEESFRTERAEAGGQIQDDRERFVPEAVDFLLDKIVTLGGPVFHFVNGPFGSARRISELEIPSHQVHYAKRRLTDAGELVPADHPISHEV